jgi:hypothetical protein
MAITAEWRRQTEPATIRQCATCGQFGREGIEVCTAHHWVGGKGHELRTYCRDVPSCFARRDQPR